MDNLAILTMNDIELITILPLIGYLIASIFITISLKRILSHRKILKGFLKAPLLNKNSQNGSYVKIKGHFSGADFKTPITNKVCCHWSLVIRAEFQSMKKKPSKGIQTHRPVIYKESSENSPMLISDGQQVVQMVLKNNFLIMSEPNALIRESHTMPLEKLTHLAKTKYKKYISVESWYSASSKVTAWGYILDRNKNCVLFSQNQDGKLPPLIFVGPEKQLSHYFSKASRYCLILILWSTTLAAGSWLWEPSQLESMPFSISMLVMLVISFLLLRKTKANLKGN